MMRKALSMMVGTLVLLMLSATAIAYEQGREWQFRVLLDGSPIGQHKFEVLELEDSKLVRSEAEFDVKFLFFKAFSYEHQNTEKWKDGCLREIDARTVTNGKEQDVSGEKDGNRFVVAGQDEQEELPGCVMTFAYWNPEFLSESRLLNPQTGEYVPVKVEELGRETIKVRDQEQTAWRYRLTTKDQDLEVWYSPDDEWLALQSVAKGGRIIRYELI